MKAEKKVEKKATPVKAVANAAVNAAAKEESAKAVKEEKAAEVKPAAKAETTVKAADDVKTEANVDTATELKAEPDHVGEVKKPARKKPAAKTTAKPTAKPAAKATEKAAKTVQETTFIEFSDCQVNIQDIIDSAKAHYKALYEKENGSLKTIALYVKPEERVAYYVANGVGSDNYKVGM